MNTRAPSAGQLQKSDGELLAAALDTACGASVPARRLTAGQPLFRAGTAVRHLFMIQRGRVRLLRHARDGAQVTLHVASDGNCVAEASLFAARYHCDAIADVPSTVAAFPKATLLDALRADDQLSFTFMAIMARQVQALRGRIELLNERSAPARVLAYLRSLHADDVGTITMAESWKSAASGIGLTHEAVYRALRALERDGYIARIDAHTIRLPPRT